jgi:hypothetical protein
VLALFGVTGVMALSTYARFYFVTWVGERVVAAGVVCVRPVWNVVAVRVVIGILRAEHLIADTEAEHAGTRSARSVARVLRITAAVQTVDHGRR